MNTRRIFAVSVAFLVSITASALAHADENVSLALSQFTDKVEQSKPSGDADVAARAKVVTYYLEVKNTGEAQDVILVWKRDGKEVAKQHLEVGRSPRWRTWGSCPVLGARELEVEVQDASGRVLKSDTLAMK